VWGDPAQLGGRQAYPSPFGGAEQSNCQFWGVALDCARPMTFVVTDNCQRCRFTDCVAVCPVDCFHGDAEMLYIDPNECIDCGACVPECPVEAIFDETQVADDKKQWIKINADKSTGLPVINSKQDALPGAEARKEELGF
jgi:ferredoxin